MRSICTGKITSGKTKKHSVSQSLLRGVENVRTPQDLNRSLMALTCEKFDKNKKYLRQQKKREKLPILQPVIETPNQTRELVVQNDHRLSTHLKSRLIFHQESLCKISLGGPNRDQKSKPPKIIFSESDLTRQRDSSMHRTALIDSFHQINHPSSDLDRTNFFAYTNSEKEVLLSGPLCRRNFNDFHFRPLVRNRPGYYAVCYTQLYCRFPKKFTNYDRIMEEQSLASNHKDIQLHTSNFVDFLKDKTSTKRGKSGRGINNFQKNVLLACQKQGKDIRRLSRSMQKSKAMPKSLKMKYVTKWLKMIESLVDSGSLSMVGSLG